MPTQPTELILRIREAVSVELYPLMRRLDALQKQVHKIAARSENNQIELPFDRTDIKQVVAQALSEMPIAKPRKRTREEKTIKQSVLDLINAHPDRSWTSPQLQAKLKIANIGSVYQVVSELAKDQMIDRVGDGEFAAARGDA